MTHYYPTKHCYNEEFNWVEKSIFEMIKGFPKLHKSVVKYSISTC